MNPFQKSIVPLIIALVVLLGSRALGAGTEQQDWIQWLNKFSVPKNFEELSSQISDLGNSFQAFALQQLNSWMESAQDINVQNDIKDESSNVNEISVVFKNESPHRVSLWWDIDENMKRVVNLLQQGEEIKMSTFPGHVFIFTREGTRDAIHTPFIMTKDQQTYILPKDAKFDDNPCKDRYVKRCGDWASNGECQKNPGWMIVNCPSACNSCELLDPKKRCDPNFLNISAQHVWEAGDLNKMFERIINDKQLVSKYDISVVKQPPEESWLLQFDSFLTQEETDVLTKWGKKLGYERSTDTGVQNERGEATKVFSQGRTSSNAWCTGECESDPVVQGVSQKIVDITKIPYGNYEQFQLLQYELGQKYNVHHDMSPKTDDSAGGVRILTFFLYLSDVEEGGETDFPIMHTKVKPKRGRAVLWPSVKDEDPMKQDPKTFHAALPVIRGTKYAANHWIHSHDFKTANKWGCTGSFD